MVDIVLIIGSNKGDCVANIESAVANLSLKVGKVLKATPIKRYDAWGFDCDDKFHNMAIKLSTELLPEELLFVIWDIERALGRERGDATEELLKFEARQRGDITYSSRTIDIDIIFYGDETIKTPLLTIPHPQYNEREYAIELLEILLMH